jgi:redox-sensitive bicupin YhaK (pirin superfamily)
MGVMDISPPTKTRKREADQRGRADHGWLQARFTFSFGGYMDPEHMGFRSLRVMNNDIIQPGGGFPTHPHANMEIFTYVIDGQLEHRDSLGNGAVLTPGNLQYMSAGSGIRHSEFNPSPTERTQLYQIWLLPKEAGGEPRYMEKPLRGLAQANALTLLYSGDGRDGSTAILQDAEIFYGEVDSGGIANAIEVAASPTLRHAWIQVISGTVSVLGHTLNTADGLAIEDAPEGFAITASSESRFLLFRLA